MGRRVEQLPENYVLDNFRAWTDRSRRNLGVDTLDLVQLHCPPTSVYTDDELYDALDTLVEEGAVAAYGVSVEKVEEALAAIARPARRDRADHRQRVPAQAASRRCSRPPPRPGVGIIARVPLASGLLVGQVRREHHVRRTTTTAPTTGTAAPSTSARPSPGVDCETGLAGGRRSSPRWSRRRPRPAPRRPRRRSPGSGSTPRCPPSSPAPATSSRPGATPPPAAWRRSATRFDPGVRRIYDEHLRASVHPRW